MSVSKPPEMKSHLDPRPAPADALTALHDQSAIISPSGSNVWSGAPPQVSGQSPPVCVPIEPLRPVTNETDQEPEAMIE
jgi:hypothetical protein